MTPEIAEDAFAEGFEAGFDEGFDEAELTCAGGECDGYVMGHRDGWLEGFDASGALTPEGLRRAGVSHLDDFVVRWDAATRAFVVTQEGREVTFHAPSPSLEL